MVSHGKQNKMSVELTEKQELFCLYMYTIGSESFGNGVKSVKRAGYKGSDLVLRGVACENTTKPNIKTRKQEIQAKTVGKIEHNTDIAIKLLFADYENLATRALKGDTAAIGARTAIMKELNEITGQHKQIFIDKTPQQRELSIAEQELADEFVAFKQRQRMKGTG